MSEFTAYCRAVAEATGSAAQFSHMEGARHCYISTNPPSPPNWINVNEQGPWGEQLAMWRERYGTNRGLRHGKARLPTPVCTDANQPLAQ